VICLDDDDDDEEGGNNVGNEEDDIVFVSSCYESSSSSQSQGFGYGINETSSTTVVAAADNLQMSRRVDEQKIEYDTSAWEEGNEVESRQSTASGGVCESLRTTEHFSSSQGDGDWEVYDISKFDSYHICPNAAPTAPPATSSQTSSSSFSYSASASSGVISLSQDSSLGEGVRAIACQSPLVSFVAPPPVPTFPTSHRGMVRPDLRFAICRTLNSMMPKLLGRDYEKPKLIAILHATMSVAMSNHPIRTLLQLKQSSQVKGVHDKLYESLMRVIGDEGAYGRAAAQHNPDDPGWASVCEAVLVTLRSGPVTLDNLLQITKDNIYSAGDRAGDSVWLTQQLLEMHLAIMWTAQARLGFEAPLVSKSKRGGSLTLSLTKEGVTQAEALVLRGAGPASPGPLRMLPSHPGADVGLAHTSVAMDCTEGGHQHHEDMCDGFDRIFQPYFSCSQLCGDYCFFHQGKILPVVIERKSISDAAQSMRDGRWASQKLKMQGAAQVWGRRRSVLIYLFEGRLAGSLVKEGRWVGSETFHISPAKFVENVDALAGEGFDVLYSSGKGESVSIIGQVAEMLSKANLTGLLTYAEFFEEATRAISNLGVGVGVGADDSRPGTDTDADTGAERTLRQYCLDNNARLRERLFSLEKNKRGGAISVGGLQAPAAKQAKLGEDGKTADDLEQLSVAELQQRCRGQSKNTAGKKADLIARLRAPSLKPSLLARKRDGLYVPSKANSNNVAMLVSMLLHDPENKGLSKEAIVQMSEQSQISENPFAGGTTQTGPYIYDGWSGMSTLKKGEVPLVVQKDCKYRLSATDKERGGVAMATDYHIMLHNMGLLGDSCPCSRTTRG